MIIETESSSKVNSIIHESNTKISELTMELEQMQLAKQKMKNQFEELNRLVAENENILKSKFETIEQYKSEIVTLNAKLSGLENDIKHEKIISHEQSIDIVKLRESLMNAERDLVSQTEQNSKNQKQITELYQQQHLQSEHQIALLRSELNQLRSNLDNSHGDENEKVRNYELIIADITSTLKQTQSEFASLKQSSLLEITRLTDTIAMLNIQILEADETNKRLVSTTESEIGALNWQIEDNLRNLKHFVDKNSELEKQLLNANATIDEQKLIIANTQTSANSSVVNELAAMQNLLDAKQEEILRSRQENSQYMSNQLDLQSAEIKDYEDRVCLLSDELEHVNNKLNEAHATIDELKTCLNTNSNTLPEDAINDLRCEIEDYKCEIDRLNEVMCIFRL